ncbi:MAG: ATP synthase F1 subunit delta [Saprospiraceae bacterium]|jgi:F-type H+-transporting ATPase subunit delta|nr:ATP synthase F1 subunit delta [Saprospiraceae bacterium]QLH30678.1 MAG: ATP synthase F1 subunit delta [Candidatus Parvibacillus calidus]MBX7179971.1 ATP synthase F1 subunit delta [Saprospiraceae bacterium]MCB0590589.1 ATP synthase F1 subunit delta [Saprospiraceae bacterium]MCO5281952.1 ATP synthase F1 subunit delta [Saprospiraceae bacterium]
MSVSQVASRYAKSLLDLAIDQKKTEAVRGDMAVFKEALKSRDLVLLLKSPIIFPDKKIAALRAVFEGKLDTLTMSFFDLTIKKGRESLLVDIADQFTEQYNTLFNIALVKVTSAAPLDEATTNIILDKIKGLVGSDKQIQLETALNPDLIGGFIIQYADRLYDSSVAYQLNKLKQTLTHN